jgi:hypothetical protein
MSRQGAKSNQPTMFDISPESEDSRKRKPSKRLKDDSPTGRLSPVDYSANHPATYVASLDVPCDRCGTEITDLAEVYRNEWLVVCGWGCGRQWMIDPIPGVLESVKKSDDEYTLRTGRHRGKTIDDVWGSGAAGVMYVKGIARVGQSTVDSRAASAWLSRKGIDP